MIDENKSYTAKEFEPNDNLFGCLHPTYIYNKNTGHYETVPCKKCTYCVNVEASKQSRRVREEIKQHQFSVMFTLTYDNEYIPRMEAFAGKHGEMQIRPIGRTKELHNCCPFNSRDFNGDYRFNDDTRIPWIEKNKIVWKNNIQFATVSKKDIQNFLKRLRKKIDNLNIPQNEKKIRYYIASEYGPTTLRPHYHGILFIDSPEVLAKIKDFIVDSWGLWVKKKGTSMSLNHLRILFLPQTTSTSVIQIQHSILQNMLQAIWVYQRCYENVVHARSTYKVKTLLLVNSKIARKKFSHLSTSECLENLQHLLKKMELKKQLIYLYPKIHYLPSSANVIDIVTYLLIQNITLITSILNTSENGKSTLTLNL